jgi:branched-chain amino acid transport system substrate-binding protein
MRSRRNRLWVVALAAVVLATATACGSTDGGSGGSTQKSVNVGLMVAETGVSASVGVYARRAVSIAFGGSSKGKVAGVTLNGVYEDSPGTPSVAVTDLDKLDSIYHVPFSLTNFSTATVDISPLAAQKKIVLINSGGFSMDLKGAGPYTFSTTPLQDTQFKAMLPYLRNTLHIKRLAFVYSDDDVGAGAEQVGPAMWKSLGGTVAGAVTVPLASTQVSTEVAELKSFKPQAVYLGTYGTGQGIIMKQAAAIGLHPVWAGAQTLANPEALQIAGAAANGVYATSVQLANNTEATTFASTYQKLYGSSIATNTYAQTTYTAMEILKDAVTVLSSEHKAITGPNLRQVILSKTFTTVLGPVKFGSDGEISATEVVTRYEGGKFVKVKV